MNRDQVIDSLLPKVAPTSNRLYINLDPSPQMSWFSPFMTSYRNRCYPELNKMADDWYTAMPVVIRLRNK